MKKRILTLAFCVTLTLAGCGNAVATNEPASSAEEATVEKAEVIEDEPKEVKEPEVSAKKDEAKTEEIASAKEDNSKAEASVEEKVEDVKAEQDKPAAEKTTETQEVTQEGNQTQSESVPEKVEAKEPTYSTIIEKYIADGDFTDFSDYGAEIGASVVKMSHDEWNIDFYFDGYVVTIGTNLQDPEWSYVGTKHPDGEQKMEYACLVAYNNVPCVPVSSSGTFVPTETLIKLEQTINYLKQNPDITQKPDIPGMTWQAWSDLVG